MRQLFWIIVMAIIGAAAGNTLRQIFGSDGDGGELNITASPGPVIAGVVSGLMSPKAKSLVALTVGANVAANEETLMERFRS